jgi:hypothetical protein
MSGAQRVQELAEDVVLLVGLQPVHRAAIARAEHDVPELLRPEHVVVGRDRLGAALHAGAAQARVEASPPGQSVNPGGSPVPWKAQGAFSSPTLTPPPAPALDDTGARPGAELGD